MLRNSVHSSVRIHGSRISRNAGGKSPPPERGRVRVGVTSGADNVQQALGPVTQESSTLVRSVGLTPTPTLPLSGGGSAPPEPQHLRFALRATRRIPDKTSPPVLSRR